MNATTETIYNVNAQVDEVFKRLEKHLSSHNVELLQQFYREELAGEKAEITILGNLQAFAIMAKHGRIDFRLDKASKEDMMELVTAINQGRINEAKESSPWTMVDYKRALKNFYKWFYDSEDPEIVSFMSVYVRESEKPLVDPDELIDVGEVEQMINEAENPRDKALLAMLWDTGARISELLALDIKDLSIQEDIIGVHLRNGKNGPRKIYIVESKPLIENWLESHPRADPEEPLFTILHSSHVADGIRRQTYNSARNQINKLAEKAEISEKKRWNPHGIRKARATDMARKGMTQPNMNAFFGWVPGSDVPQLYIRLASQDVERAVRNLYPGLDALPDAGPEYLGENIPEYGEEDLAIYQEKS